MKNLKYTMEIEITNQNVADIIFNGNYLEKLYYGNDLVWEKTKYDLQYLTIEALEPGTVGMLLPSSAYSYCGNNVIVFYTSVDNGATWQSHNSTFSVSVNTGDKVLFKHDGAWRAGTKDSWTGSSADWWYRNCIRFWCSCKYKVYGNIQSLWYGDNFANQTVIRGYRPVNENNVREDMKYTFTGLFSEHYNPDIHITAGKNNQVDPPVDPPVPPGDGTGLDAHYLVDAQNLILPLSSATTINNNINSTWLRYTYYCMFAYAKCLQYAPRFTKIDCVGVHDFDYMFYDCESLISAPISFDCYFMETATTVNSFGHTFEDCFRLVKGPTIMRPWYNISTMYNNGVSRTKDFLSENNTFCNCQSLAKPPVMYTGYNQEITRNVSIYNSSTNMYDGVFGNCRSLENLEYYVMQTGTKRTITLTFANDGTYTITPVVKSNAPFSLPTGWTYEQASIPN